MFPFHISSPVVEHAGVVIHRSPEVVFRFIGEQFLTNYPRWSPEVQELKQIGSGPVRTGTRARQVRVDLGHRSESIFAVTIFEAGRRVCFEGVSSPYRCDYEIKGIPPQASTLICFTFELSNLEMYLLPFEGLIRSAVRDGVERTVRNVKSLVEAESTDRVTGPLLSPHAGGGSANVLRPSGCQLAIGSHKEMGAQLIDGKSIRTKILHQIDEDLIRLKRRTGGVPGLAIIHVGDDPASIAYIRQKKLAAQGLGTTTGNICSRQPLGNPN